MRKKTRECIRERDERVRERKVRGERVRARGGGERERGSPPPFESSSLFLMECHFFTVIVMDWNSTMVHVVSRITNSEKETNVESRNKVVTGDGHKQECARES